MNSLLSSYVWLFCLVLTTYQTQDISSPLVQGASETITQFVPVPTTPTTTSCVFSNEIHYQNTGADVGERIEIAGEAGTSLSGWSVVFYDGSTGQTYATANLSGTIPSTGTCSASGRTIGTVVIDVLSATGFAFQNLLDGWALVNGTSVVEFYSYTGSFTATNGPANGLTSTDIGVTEPTDAPVGSSIQRTGANSWSYNAGTNTFGACNTTQSVGNCGVSLPLVNLNVSRTDGTEVNSTAITVTASTNSPVTGNQTVSLGVSGTNVTTGDYTLTNTTITIPNGQSSGSVTFTVTNDASIEGVETATLTISNPSSGVVIGGTPSRNITLYDNDIASATSCLLFSNEIHYDNTGSDANERIEIAGTAGTNLTGWSVIFYDGSNGTPYTTATLTGTVPNANTCTISSRTLGLVTIDVVASTGFAFQNDVDGWALAYNSTVTEFFSYEGTFTAASGPAMGLTSTNIGASEDGTGTSTGSIQRSSSTTWTTNSSTNTFGACNTTQFATCICPTFSGAPSNVTIVNSSCNAACGVVSGTITAPNNPCPVGSTVQYQVNGGMWSTTLPTYTQTAQSIKTRCNCNFDNVNNSPESAAVTTSPATCTPPSTFTVTGGGVYCPSGASVAVGLNGSQTGVSYQLKRNGTDVGSPVNGTGMAISFPTQTIAGTYTVVASKSGGTCLTNMTGNATVVIGPTATSVTTNITTGTVLIPAGTITATNQITNANVTYRANQSVTLLQGFSATGNTFLATIQAGCY